MAKLIRKNQEGFTLTEVLISMMILTIAIVSATSLLVGLIDTNKNIVDKQKAYYLAQEGLEAIRNMRDTNWLNNIDWNGKVDVFGTLEIDSEYVLGLKATAWKNSSKDIVKDVNRYKVWDFMPYLGENDRICVIEEDGSKFMGLCPFIGGEDTGFRRRIKISKYCDTGEKICEDSFEVTSIVDYGTGSNENHFEMSMVLTDWKGGVL